MLDWKSRIDEAVETFGQLGQVLSFVTSWRFLVGLLIAGVAYVIFVPVEEYSSSRYPSVGATIARILGWVTVSAYVLFLWGAIVAGYVLTFVPQPKIAVDSELDLMSIIYENKEFQRKASKRARIMVTNVGKKTVDNVKAFVTKVDNINCRLQLPVSSLDTVFDRPNPPPVESALTLNPGEEQYFDALVECIAPTCPGGDLVIPTVEGGRRRFGNCFETGKDVLLRPKTLTIKVFGNGGDPVTRIFLVSKSGKELLLNP